MLTPLQLLTCTADIILLYSKLQNSIAADITRRICKAGKITESAKWQINSLKNLGILYRDVSKEIQHINTLSQKGVTQLFTSAAKKSVKYDTSIYTAAGLPVIPFNMSPAALQVLEAGVKKTQGNLQNLTRTTALSAQQTFINACTLAEMQVSSGAFDYITAIRTAIKNSVSDGYFVTYPDGHQEKLDVAVRRNVLTGLSQTTGEISLLYADELGCDLMEITAHAGARPSHSAWQGQIVSRSGRKGYLSLDDIGYGTGDGFKGWNCRHDWYPYIEGVSTSMYSEETLSKLESKSIEYNGRQYTEYEAEQKMRGYERNIRDTRRMLAAYDEGKKSAKDEKLYNALQEDFTKAAVKLKKQELKLNTFCEDTGILKETDRIQTYGFNKSVSQKAVWVNKKHNT